ncbi:VOC family protein, partial [Candidatus Fermentibacteria bacterium]|nr:VOC family protein [Candidatus Fermentibacteria bacterium]
CSSASPSCISNLRILHPWARRFWPTWDSSAKGPGSRSPEPGPRFLVGSPQGGVHLGGHPSLDHAGCVYRTARAAHAMLGDCLGLRFLRSFTLTANVATALFRDPAAVSVLVFGNDQRLVEAIVCPDHVPADSPAHICLAVSNREDVVERCRARSVEVRTAWVGDHEVCFVADADGNLFEIKQA